MTISVPKVRISRKLVRLRPKQPQRLKNLFPGILNNRTWKKHGGSRQKYAVVKSRSKASVRGLFLLSPLVITTVTLSLNWCNVYLTGGITNQTLALLQIVAKAHDILIAFSLSEVLLYYLRQQLTSDNGIGFGLFSAAYSVGVGSLPFLRSF